MFYRAAKRWERTLWALALGWPFACLAQPAERSLADLSLEELAQIQVTSVFRRATPLSDAPASLYVISREDIRRAGVTTLPEALRLAPNLQVARVTANRYAISARGFNNAIGNKLLVLVDGRTIYTPLFSGVFWDQQDVMLEDIERIEVISGPGATLWGVNAVNGVINIITRHSRDTQGVLVAAGGGNREQQAAVRYGGRLGDSGHFRIYAKRFDMENTTRANGTSVPDGWQNGQVGFRADWRSDRNEFTLQGDSYSGKSEVGFVPGFVIPPSAVSGTNILARWKRTLSSSSDIHLQAYYDHSKRDDPLFYRPEQDIFDIEFQHGIRWDRHRIVWGAGYRHARDDVGPGLVFSAFIPRSRSLDWTNVFVQDEIKLTDTLSVTPGMRLEHNDYTGLEYLPSARVAWKFSPAHLVWGAASRAVRAPSRFDRDVVNPPRPPFAIQGGPNFVSEVAKVYEIGFRGQATRQFAYSLTAFRHDWKRLRSASSPPFPLFLVNNVEGFINGVEAWVTYQPMPTWRIEGGYTSLREHLGVTPGVNDPVGPRNATLANDPDHQWMLRSSFDLPGRHELDFMLRRVASLPLESVPGYTAFDARWGWKVTRQFEVSVTLQNLFDRQHAEFGAPAGRSEFERAILLKVLWRQ
jgi:iron complex outermembrane receptor protein